MTIGKRGHWRGRANQGIPDDEHRMYSLRIKQGLLNDLHAQFPEMEVSEAIRFAIAYTIDKKPKVRLPVEVSLTGTVIK